MNILKQTASKHTNKKQEPDTEMRSRDSFLINKKHQNCRENSYFHQRKNEINTNKQKPTQANNPPPPQKKKTITTPRPLQETQRAKQKQAKKRQQEKKKKLNNTKIRKTLQHKQSKTNNTNQT